MRMGADEGESQMDVQETSGESSESPEEKGFAPEHDFDLPARRATPHLCCSDGNVCYCEGNGSCLKH